MRTRQKARLEAELAATAAAAAAATTKGQQSTGQETQIKNDVLQQSPSLEYSPERVHNPEPSEKIHDVKGSSEYVIEPSESSESGPEEEEEEEEEEISDDDGSDNDDKLLKERSTKQQGSVNNDGADLLLFEPKSTRDIMSSLLPTVTGGFASSLKPDINEEMYFDFDSVMMGGSGSVSGGRVVNLKDDPDKELMKRSVLPPDLEKRETAPLIYQSKISLQKLKKAERKKSAGSQWFDMPATEITPELKNDLRLLRMRNALDPSRHYKANDSKQLPRYFQVGRVVGGPTDFYSSRIPRRQQKQTLVDELLTNEDFRKYHKKKYLELQNKFSSGTKRHRNIKHRKKYKK